MADNVIMVIGILVIVILVIVALFTIATTSNQAKTTQASSIPTISSAPTSTVPVNTSQKLVISPASPASQSVSSLFINQSEAASLMGQGGSYGVYQRTTQAQLQYVVPPAFLQLNVTAEYNMTYNASKSGSASILAEVIFPTKSPAKLYSYIMSQYPYFNRTALAAEGANVLTNSLNATIPGFTYSQSSFSASTYEYNQTTNKTKSVELLFQIMLGYTSNSTLLVSILRTNATAGINATQLATLVAKNDR